MTGMSDRIRNVAFCDYLTRVFHELVKKGGHDLHHGSHGADVIFSAITATIIVPIFVLGLGLVLVLCN